MVSGVDVFAAEHMTRGVCYDSDPKEEKAKRGILPSRRTRRPSENERYGRSLEPRLDYQSDQQPKTFNTIPATKITTVCSEYTAIPGRTINPIDSRLFEASP
jgi:hypothetical protein